MKASGLVEIIDALLFERNFRRVLWNNNDAQSHQVLARDSLDDAHCRGTDSAGSGCTAAAVGRRCRRRRSNSEQWREVAEMVGVTAASGADRGYDCC